jgi:hypothetical protein
MKLFNTTLYVVVLSGGFVVSLIFPLFYDYKINGFSSKPAIHIIEVKHKILELAYEAPSDTTHIKPLKFVV